MAATLCSLSVHNSHSGTGVDIKQSDLISILSGATAPEQVRENVAALNINLSDADATLMREMAEALER